VIINEDAIMTLITLIANSEARIIVLDPLINFLADGLYDNATMAILIDRLNAIAIDNNAAIIILHHTKKGADLESIEAVMGQRQSAPPAARSTPLSR
jgi:RecA-family ATPase